MLLVSNRLPVTVVRRRGNLEFAPSPGGLAVGLEAFYAEHEARWVGWPGEIESKDRARVARRLKSQFRCHPVFLPEHVARRYYAGFSNRTLWPLFHSFSGHVRYDPLDWEAYRRANDLFADAVRELAAKDEVIWVHDYHLLLLPKLIRERLPDARIGFFLHVPFPPYSTLRLLPWAREIVEALLGADLVGFHTFDDAQAYISCVRRFLGLDNEIGRIFVGRRVVEVDVFPMGADVARIERAVQEPAVQWHVARLREGLGTAKLTFSLSRLDYTKGVPQQLEALEAFLQGRPEWRGRFVHHLVVVPSREIVDRYAEEKREIDRLVGRINGRYGSFNWMPIRYVYRYLDFDELVALYAAADVAVVTPLRDGMNLVAKEFLAAKVDLRGALVLSEMAGASKELLESLIVNPNHPAEVAEALRRALEMPEGEQVQRNRAMRSRLEKYDVRRWASHFLERLEEAAGSSRSLAVRVLTRREARAIEDAFEEARNRLILLDYDGTLVPFTDDPREAAPPRRVRALLKTLSAAPGNQIVLLSGRRKMDLEGWFEGLWLTLVAEHGAWVRRPDATAWEATANLDVRWKERVRPILARFTERVPGSLLEEKETSLAWHYRRVHADTGLLAARELIDALTNLTANLDLAVLLGNKAVEVRPSRMTKGAFYASQYAGQDWDFVLAAGDDWTDESLFAALPPNAVSLRVGFAASAARFNVPAQKDLLSLLERLAAQHPIALEVPKAA